MGHNGSVRSGGAAGVERQQLVEDSFLDLPVRDAEQEHSELRIVVLDCEVSRLVHEGGGVRIQQVETLEPVKT